jgi:lipoate-protein ligase A
MSQLRNFCHHSIEPCFNMAFDEAMLERAADESELLLLRLYTWEPAAITIGVNQRAERAVRLENLGDTPLVRRITGGRAVYHSRNELTYAVALNLDNPALVEWRSSVQAVYLRLAEGLRLFLGRLGLSAQIVRRSGDARAERSDYITAACFESAARYELTVGGGKVLASAQHQSGRAILQHGSIKLHGLVAHPALSGIASAANPTDQPIERENLERFSAQFAEAFQDWLGVTADGSSAGNCALAGLDERVAAIRRNPLARRIPLERYSR